MKPISREAHQCLYLKLRGSHMFNQSTSLNNQLCNTIIELILLLMRCKRRLSQALEIPYLPTSRQRDMPLLLLAELISGSIAMQRDSVIRDLMSMRPTSALDTINQKSVSIRREPGLRVLFQVSIWLCLLAARLSLVKLLASEIMPIRPRFQVQVIIQTKI